MSWFISDALADVTSQAATPSDGMFPMVMIGVIFAAFYFMLIRPQNKRAKEQKDMVSRLKKGDEVVTTSGIYAKIVNVGEQQLKLSIAENVEITVQSGAIMTLLPKGTIKSLA